MVAGELHRVEETLAHVLQLGADLAGGAGQPLVAGPVLGRAGEGLEAAGVGLGHRRQLQLPAAPDLVAQGTFAALVRRLVEQAPVEAVGQVLLGHPVVAVGVGIEVAGAVAEALRVPVGVLQRVRDLAVALGLDRGQGVEEGEGGVALRRRGQVEGGLGEVEPALGQADPVEGLGRGGDHPQGFRVGEAHVLAGEDQHAAEEEPGVLAGMDHAGQPVDRGVGVRPAQRLDQGGDRIEVVVALLVVEHRPPLDRFLGHRQVDADHSRLVLRGRLHRQLQGVEQGPGVAVADIDEVGESILVEIHREVGVPPWVVQGVAGDAAQVGGFQVAELEEAAARDEGPVDREVGVLRRGSDQHHRAVLDPGQQSVLLGLVEPVYLVDEQGGPVVVEAAPVLGLLHGPAYIGDPGEDGVDGGEVGLGRVGDDVGQRRLAGAGGPVEDQGGELVGLDGPSQEAARTQDVVLAHELVEGARPQPGGQGLVPLQGFPPAGLEEIQGLARRLSLRIRHGESLDPVGGEA